MKVLHFTEHYLAPSETFIKGFVEKSCEFSVVGVAAFHFHNISEHPLEPINYYKINNPHYSRKSLQGVMRFIKEKLTRKKIWYAQFNQALDNFKPDVVHCHFGPIGVLMMEFTDRFKKDIPFVTSFYGYDISSLPLSNKDYMLRLKKLLCRGNGFFAEGPALKQKIINLGAIPAKCFINPILISLPKCATKISYKQSGKGVKFLFVGRFVEKKGLQVFFNVLGYISNRITPFTIGIVGYGPMKPAYEQIILELKLGAVVKWHGILSHEQILAMMPDFDFLVHPSLTATDGDSEGGAPTIIIEAQATGLPVITTRHADIPYIMGYHEFLADENDVSSLTDAIGRIVECKNIEYYTRLGKEKVLKDHDLATNTIYQTNLNLIINRYYARDINHSNR